jgi:ABC-2 type transport system permease protein
MGVVTLKEVADHFTSILVVVLMVLVVATAIAVVRGAVDQIKEVTAEDPFLFLRLFTRSGGFLPLVALLSFLVPLIAIGLGFDAVNGEHNRRTLSRILSQPIYRDALLLGKFLAGLATVAVSLLCMWLLVIGIGLLAIGVPPSGEEIARIFVFLFVTVAYAGVWLALAMLFSTLFRAAATAALITLGLWLLFSLLWPVLSSLIANAISPPDLRYALLGLPDPDTLMWQKALARLSPTTLYGECVLAVLNPEVRTLGLTFVSDMQGMYLGAPLPFGQSLLIAWPQMVGLFAGTILLFAITYVTFQRQEVRA